MNLFDVCRLSKHPFSSAIVEHRRKALENETNLSTRLRKGVCDIMTQNQIAYWNLVEQRTHNRRTESETYRANKAHEKQIDVSNAETERANRAREANNINVTAEAARHNQATEALTGTDLNIKAGQLAETTRSNKQQELLKQQEVSEKKLANDIQKEWNDAKIQLEKDKTEAAVYKDKGAAEYYEKQAEDLTNKIETYFQKYQDDRNITYLEEIRKYISELLKLWPTVKGAKG